MCIIILLFANVNISNSFEIFFTNSVRMSIISNSLIQEIIESFCIPNQNFIREYFERDPDETLSYKSILSLI